MPKTEGTNPEMQIAAALDSIGIHQDAENADGLSYQMGFRIDETGYRRKKYDLAVLKHGHPKLLIEYDGNYEIVCMFAYPRPKKTTSCPATGIAEVVFYGINYELTTAASYTLLIWYFPKIFSNSLFDIVRCRSFFVRDHCPLSQRASHI